jgi:hypothetical protein
MEYPHLKLMILIRSNMWASYNKLHRSPIKTLGYTWSGNKVSGLV